MANALKKDGYNAEIWGDGILVSGVDSPNPNYEGTVDMVWDEDGIYSDDNRYSGDDHSYDKFLDIIAYPEDYNGQWESKQVSGSTNDSLNEAEVKSDEDFKEYAFTVLKKAFGEDFDEEKAQEVVDGLLSKHGEDYGTAVGALQASMG